MKVFNYTIFPTIITEVDCDLYPQIRNDLIDWIYEYQSKTESVSHSNRGGWQSPSDFYEQESFSEFKNYILMYSLTALKHYDYNFSLGNMWININKKGDHNVSHIHGSCILSGVFWVKTPKNSGDLVFASPNAYTESGLLDCVAEEISQSKDYFSHFNFTPAEGTIVLFPPHLYHNVETNESDEDRISIAFNLR
jgi:uncharacterized protein (TIGR02466 family)